MASDDQAAPINRVYDKPVEYVPVARHLLFTSNRPLVNPPDEGGRRWIDLRAFGKSRVSETTRTMLGAYFDEMVMTPIRRAEAVFDAPPDDILIRTASASYPAALLQPETQGV